VLAAAAAWLADDASPGAKALGDWIADLPGAVETGPLPSQAEIDRWAATHTADLIDRFPLTITPQTALVVATALASKVSWRLPFELAASRTLGDGDWAGRIDAVLTAPAGREHQQFVAATAVGDVAVHAARAQEGMLVVSVIADAGVAPADVLATAYGIAGELAGDGGVTGRRSLFDLPLGTTPLWTIIAEAVQTTAPDGREEQLTAFLPAWSASGEHELMDPDLGLATALRALAVRAGQPEADLRARQAVVARYTRTGFEAAAVTGGMMLTSLPMRRDGIRRTAELRFGHPYAVVAVAVDPDGGNASPWHGVPVYSAWVAEPDNAV
jgi:hypothetical protein